MDEARRLHRELLEDAEAGGYHINPDMDITMPLVQGLLTNEERYGYRLCPCRLTEGSMEADLDVICPCDYRDLDLEEYDACYCGLYVSGRVPGGEAQVGPIPERRPEKEDIPLKEAPQKSEGIKVWRCKVCGYLCARVSPPETCPICKVSRERFELFTFT